MLEKDFPSPKPAPNLWGKELELPQAGSGLELSPGYRPPIYTETTKSLMPTVGPGPSEANVVTKKRIIPESIRMRLNEPLE
jgi:hypothetical protein